MIDLDSQIKSSMLVKDVVRLSVLRRLKAAVNAVLTSNGRNRKPLSDEEFIGVVRKQISQSNDSIEAYTNAGILNRADAETAEKNILETFLPASLSDDEICAIIDRVIAATGATSKKDMGRVIAAAKDLCNGAVDPKVLSRRIASKLA